MARAMMCAVEWRRTSSGLAVLRGQDPQLDRLRRSVLERPVQVDDLPVGHRRDGRIGQPLADPGGHFTGTDSSGNSLTEPSGSLIWSIVGRISDVVGLLEDPGFFLPALDRPRLTQRPGLLPMPTLHACLLNGHVSHREDEASAESDTESDRPVASLGFATASSCA